MIVEISVPVPREFKFSPAQVLNEVTDLPDVILESTTLAAFDDDVDMVDANPAAPMICNSLLSIAPSSFGAMSLPDTAVYNQLAQTPIVQKVPQYYAAVPTDISNRSNISSLISSSHGITSYNSAQSVQNPLHLVDDFTVLKVLERLSKTHSWTEEEALHDVQVINSSHLWSVADLRSLNEFGWYRLALAPIVKERLIDLISQ